MITQLVALISSKQSVSHKIKLLKTFDLSNLDAENLSSIFNQIRQSSLKREFISQIGKARHLKFKSFVMEILKNDDPKLVIQAIRALIALKDEDMWIDLQNYRNHSNELVKNYVANLLANKKTSPTIKTVTTKISADKRLKNLVINGDVLQIMCQIEDNSVHLTFTSPPYYNARDYSIYPSYNAYLEFLAQIFKEIHRLTYEGRFFIINTSPIIMARASRQTASKRYPIPFDIHPLIEQAGFEFVDDILWVKPEPSVKNRNGGFMQHRKPLGYKPNIITEYIMVYRKQTNKLIDWNMRQYEQDIIAQSKVINSYETTNVWRIDPTSNKNHSAIFPDELCRRIITFYSYVGDLVFDPFAGSGTVGKVTLENKRNFLLTELSP